VWLLTDTLTAGDARLLLDTRCTDLALQTDAATLTGKGELIAELELIREHNRQRDDAPRLRVVIGLRRMRSFVHGFEALKRAAELEVDAVRLLSRRDARYDRFVQVARDALSQLDVSLVENA
jgi:hypothetical protein